MSFIFKDTKSIVITCFFMFFLVVESVFAIVGVGGYVPFGMNTQKEAEGGTNALTFHPMITVNKVFKINEQHFFVPEIGYAYHLNTGDNYDKKTIFILWDMGIRLGHGLVFHYGLGTFMTKISGDGGAVEVRNGESGTATFYMPSETVTSYNTTVNAGLELIFDPNYAAKIESYLFSPASSDKMKISYSLSLNYYL